MIKPPKSLRFRRLFLTKKRRAFANAPRFINAGLEVSDDVPSQKNVRLSEDVGHRD